MAGPFSRGTVLCAALAALVPGAQGVELRVAATLSADVDSTPESSQGILTARPVAGKGTESESPSDVSVAVRLPGETVLELAENVVWEVTLEAKGYWAAAGYAEPGREESLRLSLLRTGRLAGTLKSVGREPLPASLEARFEASGEAPGESLEGNVDCEVEQERWWCEIPADTLDVRLRAPGFIPHYLWGMEISAGETATAGPLLLKRGSSIAGWVETVTGEPLDVESCKVSLTPRLTQNLKPGSKVEGSRFALASRVSPRGFFQLEGVAPGSYTLAVEHKGYAPAEVKPVIVEEGRSTELPQPVVLRPPLDLEVVIDPATDEQAGRWKVEVYRADSLAGPITAGRTNDEGRFQAKGLPAADYNLAVLNSSGSRVALEEVALEPGISSFHIDLPIVWVEGRVLLGDEPLAARLAFGGFHSFVSVRLESDDDGEFSGFLPRDGTWKVDVRSDEPAVRRSLRKVEVEAVAGGGARVEIELPDTVLEGETVDVDGRPVAGAQVLVVPFSEGEGLSNAASDDDGVFRFRGFAPGDFQLEAHNLRSATHLSSDPIRVHMEQGESSRHVLVLKELSVLRGRVVSSGGPVPGARIEARLPPGSVSGLLLPSARTGFSGDFAMEMPGLPAMLDVTVMAPGFVFRRLRAYADPSESLVISLDQYGGTLVIDRGPDPETTPSGDPHLIVFSGEFQYHISELSQWAFMNGGGRADTGTYAIPMMPPGFYTACPGSVAATVGREEGSQALRSKCVSGFLPSSGDLRLLLP